jgi:CheY-like chemotaxis protein
MVPSGLNPAVPSGQGKHVLVVDDDAIWASVVSQILQQAGFVARQAPDYRTALEVLESNAPVDVLLTDIVMPDRINGVALGRMARMRRSMLPVVYMTAYDIPGLANEVQGEVLMKPISDRDPVNAVQRALMRI